MRNAGIGLVFVVLAGCATTSAQNDEETVVTKKKVVTRERTTGVAPTQDRQWMEMHSEASAVGRIADVSQERLELTPYATREELNFHLAGQFPVVTPGREPVNEAIVPGRDVRVFYTQSLGKDPEVVGIEVLDPAEAKRLQHDAPPPAPPPVPAEPIPDHDDFLPSDE